MSATTRERLDLALCRLGLAPSRSRAQDLIRRGLVSVDGEPVIRPGAPVGLASRIEIAPGTADYVSRGGLKLKHAIDHFGFEAGDRIALDIGASTGGFTEVLLAQGVRKVYAVDVGRDQLAQRLRSDPRVISLEGLDARALSRTHIAEPVEAIVADVSFISLTQALAVPLSFATAGAFLIALVKPQFEAGRRAVGKGGVVRAQADRERAIERVVNWLAEQPGWRMRGVTPSPVAGGSGNQEYLLGAILQSGDESAA